MGTYKEKDIVRGKRIMKNGMLAVYYDMIDVDMQRLDTI